MINSKLYKIKSDKLAIWTAWCNRLVTDLQQDSLQTLEQENASFELFVNFEIDGQWYSLGVMAAKDDQRILAADKDSKINQEHIQMKKECLEKSSEPQIGYFLKNF